MYLSIWFCHSVVDTQTRVFVELVILTTLLVLSAEYLQTRACASAHTLSGPPCSLLSPFICIFALFSPTYVKGKNANSFYACVISYGIWKWLANFKN